ncbi:MAG TPA: GNAT family N-acetyltransferase [Anaerolineales bacterium]|nr:GNAT family N-acetyltransferase [Anaerolineales bacterium]
MSEIQIRPTVAGDLPRLMGMDHSISSEYVWQLELRRDGGQITATFREVRLPRPIPLTYPNNPFAVADEWTRKAMILTALADNNPIGYLSLTDRPASVAWISDLVVAPEWRRRGVAGALLNAAQDWSLGRGHRRLFLEMPSKNQPAIRLAQKHGYDFCGYNDHYYATQDVALFFARALK